jgi:hypothetical protein
MFQSSANRLHAWLKLLDDALDDVLGDPPVVDAPRHPHRRQLRLERRRRPGSVPASPASCLSPVRSGVVSRDSREQVS